MIALILGVLLRELRIFRPNILEGIDAYGLMMLSIMIIIFAPLSTISIEDLINLIVPLLLAFILGITGSIITAILIGKLVGYSTTISIAIALTSLFGFPDTMILSKEAAQSVGDSEEEIQK